jgi:hypothetical protein
MSNYFSFFRSPTISSTEEMAINRIFPMELKENVFVKADIISTYRKILTDTVERVSGIPDDVVPMLWDNCLQNESQFGLISMLAEAMYSKRDLFIVVRSGIIREASNEERSLIKAAYEKGQVVKDAVFVSFKNYDKTDMLKIYSTLEYCSLASLHKNVNISKALQLKIKSLRATVSLSDEDVAKEQAKAIAKGLGDGKDVYMDSEDSIDTSSPDITPTEKAISFTDTKRAYILGFPISYISGIQTPGIGSTGESDMRAVERGLKQYFFEILSPILKALFGIAEPEFISQDFRAMTTNLEVLKTFDLVSDDYLSASSKQKIVARVFELDPDEEAEQIEEEQAEAEEEVESNPPPAPNAFAQRAFSQGATGNTGTQG